ncbi:MAG: methyltransferase domain-containing protein [Armatimonadota bacterium]|jgi:SAM-dependent methyltransferase
MISSERQEPWYETFFTDDYLEHWIGGGIDRERTKRETDFVVEVLGLAPGMRVLDLCCGQGRHAVELARRGCRVVGVDLSAPLLEAAERAVQEAGVQVEYVHSDMREIAFDSEFDAAINMFTAFGYFDSDEEDLMVLQAVAGALRPGGKLLIDLLNRDWLMGAYEPRRWRETTPGWFLFEERQWDPRTGRNTTHATIVGPNGERRGYDVGLRMYTYTELAGLMSQAGLAPTAAYGSFDRGELARESRRMIVVAQKPGGS